MINDLQYFNQLKTKLIEGGGEESWKKLFVLIDGQKKKKFSKKNKI
jgi:hypothetical protein